MSRTRSSQFFFLVSKVANRIREKRGAGLGETMFALCMPLSPFPAPRFFVLRQN